MQAVVNVVHQIGEQEPVILSSTIIELPDGVDTGEYSEMLTTKLYERVFENLSPEFVEGNTEALETVELNRWVEIDPIAYSEVDVDGLLIIMEEAAIRNLTGAGVKTLEEAVREHF